MIRNPRNILLTCLLGAALIGCENGAPPTAPPIIPTAPPTAAATATASVPAPNTPTEAPAPATPTGPAATATSGLPPATPAAGVLTPPAAGSPTPSALHTTSGLVFVSNGNLTFYDADHQETRALVEVVHDPPAPQRITAFAVAPTGDRLAYLLTEQRTAGGACRAGTQLWLLDLNNINNRRQLAPSVLAEDCKERERTGVVQQGLAFAPDGARLAYLAGRADGGPIDLWTVNSDTDAEAAPQRLAAPEAGLLLNPTWAPDGKSIAFLVANDLGTNGSYDADLTILPVPADANTQPHTVAQGHALPGGHLALPPFDLTWLDPHTLAFQAWNPTRGPDGGWVVDTAGTAAPQEIDRGQAGLGAWSPPGANGARWYAYRVAGLGLAVTSGATATGALLAPVPEAGPNGAVPPIWSADAGAVAFSTSDGRLLIADRAAPGAPIVAALPQVLHAAWSATPGAPPLLAAVTSDGKTLTVFDRRGQPLHTETLSKVTGAPQEIVWEPAPAGADTQRIAVRYAGGPNDATPFVLFSFSSTGRGPGAQALAAVDDDSTLQWIMLGPLPEP
ncbi:MAG TPA: hypothetical protein VF276_06925 [Chloroflexia bacterium]